MKASHLAKPVIQHEGDLNANLHFPLPQKQTSYLSPRCKCSLWFHFKHSVKLHKMCNDRADIG